MALTNEELKRLVAYDEATGQFRWLVDRSRARAGDVAGFPGGKGYRQITINSTHYYVHRLAWLYAHGQWPSGHLDHINGDRADNRIANLRLATIRQNAANQRKRLGKSSSLKGVSWHAARGKWSAHIRIGGKSTYLGQFETEDAAHQAYLVAAEDQFGEFARAS